eukprot:PITA_28302
MLDIDPSIIVHEIPTYPGVKPVRQHLCPVHPRKATTIKSEVEKLLKAGFIYPIPLTNWVSNIFPVTKKQGTIRVCVDYRDINRACPKDNYPTPFIDQLINECVGSEMYSFMDSFSGYNQIKIVLADQYKTAFISHSAKCQDHPSHLLEIFLHCRHYHIWLNPHKCVFCIESDRLLGFIISQEGIHLDPLKVKAILNLPPPASLRQLQSLQGKANFLRRFIPNYDEVAKGFTRSLKWDTPFLWDAAAQESFERLKVLLVFASLLHPPNYHHDYTLYLAAADTTIGMVLVQDDDDDTEHVIYHLNRNLLDTESRYAYFEKLALATICVVQCFHHYILLCTTTVVSGCNPMTYILSHQLLGGKYLKWIVILQEFDLEFTTTKS